MCDTPCDAVAVFSERLRQKGTAETVRYYLADLQQFMQWLQTQGVSFDRASQGMIRSYVRYLSSVELSSGECQRLCYAPSTIRRKLSVLSAFYAWSLEKKLLSTNPAMCVRHGLDTSERSRRRPSHVRQFSTTPDLTTIRGLRDQAILALLASEGLKVSQLHQLDLADIDVEAGVIQIRKRNGKCDPLILSDTSRQALSRWLKIRHLVQNGRDEAVFVSVHWTAGRAEPGGRISKRGLAQLVKGYCATSPPYASKTTEPPRYNCLRTLAY